MSHHHVGVGQMQTAVQTDFLSCIQVSTVQLHGSTGKIFQNVLFCFTVSIYCDTTFSNIVAHFHFWILYGGNKETYVK